MATKSSVSRVGPVGFRILYVVLWLLAPAFLLVFANQVRGLSITIIAVWSTLVVSLWIAWGDRSDTYKTTFGPYRSIWICLLLLFLVIFLASYLSIARVRGRVAALRGVATLLERTISHIDDTDSPASVEYWVNTGLMRSLENDLKLRDAASLQPDTLTFLEDQQRAMHGEVFLANHFAGLAHELAQELVERERALRQEGVVARGTTFEPVLSITTRLVSSTQGLETAFTGLVDATGAAQPGSQQDLRTLRVKSIELTSHFIQARALVQGAKSTVYAGVVDVISPFQLVIVLYAIFMVFPWGLLILFLLRKRDRLVWEKAELLEELNLGERYLERSPQTELLEKFRKAEEVEAKRGILTDEVSQQAFRSSEYVVSLTGLTFIIGALSYASFFPHSVSGLAEFMSQGGSVRQLANYLTRDATPITFGFLGAYFFIVQMLLRRYFAADLSPKAYIYAVVRVVVVFLLALVLQLINAVSDLSPAYTSALSFVFGIFPTSGLNWFLRWVGEKFPFLRTQEGLDRYPLVKIDGINTWHEARLLEEKVENVQNLATTSLDDLVIHTNFSPLQLVDWVDQALLYVHTKDRWMGAFQAAGVRTATDLLDNVRKGRDGSFDRNEARRLAKAINAALTYTSADAEDLLKKARSAAAELDKTLGILVESARATEGVSRKLTPDKPETLNALAALQKSLEELTRLAKETEDGITRDALPLVTELETKDGQLAQEAKAALDQIRASSGSVSAEAEGAHKAAKAIDPAQAQTLERLPSLKESIQTLLTSVEALKARVEDAGKKSGEASEAAESHPEWGLLNRAYKALQVSIGGIQEKVKGVQDLSEPLSVDAPESLDRASALRSRISELKQAGLEAQAKLKDAREAVRGLQSAQSADLPGEVDTGLETAADSLKRLMSLTIEAERSAEAFDVGKPDTLAGISEVKEAFVRALEAAVEAQFKGKAAADALQAVSMHSVMTVELLETMEKAIARGPNIQKLHDFWKKRR